MPFSPSLPLSVSPYLSISGTAPISPLHVVHCSYWTLYEPRSRFAIAVRPHHAPDFAAMCSTLWTALGLGAQNIVSCSEGRCRVTCWQGMGMWANATRGRARIVSLPSFPRSIVVALDTGEIACRISVRGTNALPGCSFKRFPRVCIGVCVFVVYLWHRCCSQCFGLVVICPFSSNTIWIPTVVSLCTMNAHGSPVC